MTPLHHLATQYLLPQNKTSLYLAVLYLANFSHRRNIVVTPLADKLAPKKKPLSPGGNTCTFFL